MEAGKDHVRGDVLKLEAKNCWVVARDKNTWRRALKDAEVRPELMINDGDHDVDNGDVMEAELSQWI